MLGWLALGQKGKKWSNMIVSKVVPDQLGCSHKWFKVVLSIFDPYYMILPL